ARQRAKPADRLTALVRVEPHPVECRVEIEVARRASTRPAALRVRRIWEVREVTVERRQFAAVLVTARDEHTYRPDVPAPGKRGVPVSLRSVHPTVVRRSQETVLVRTSDEVHHSCDSVGAISGRRRILEYLDPSERTRRDQVHID